MSWPATNQTKDLGTLLQNVNPTNARHMPSRDTTMPLAVIFSTIFSLSLMVGIDWWNEANLPMTAERYAASCGNRPECYPEIGYLVGSVLAAIVAFFTDLLTIVFAGMSMLRR
jgi:hypothetical protein